MPDDGYEETWQRLLAGAELNGIGARLDGRLVGIAHYLFHVTIWSADACYLQDLFVDEAARGQGAAREFLVLREPERGLGRARRALSPADIGRRPHLAPGELQKLSTATVMARMN